MEDYVKLQQGKFTTWVWFYRDGMVRVRRSLTGEFRDKSPILMPLESKRYFTEEDEEYIAWPCEKPEVSPNGKVLTGCGMTLTFDEDGALSWTDGSATFREIPGRHLLLQGAQLIHSFCLEECLYYGFGEKTGPLEKTGTRMRFGGKDACGYDPEKTDPLYKHVPFFLKLSKDGERCCGVFYHTAADCEIDIGREYNGYFPPMGQFVTQEPEIDLFLIRGKDMAEILTNFTTLTGRPAFPPKYALGYLGSTMYYTELPQNCDEALLYFVEKTKRMGIPCSNFQLSSGYTTDSQERRNVFHWNREKFPDPARFVRQMELNGAPVTPNIKPALLTTNPLYGEFAAAGAFIRNRDGSPMVSRFWGGQGSFVDFTNPRARQLWKYHLKKDLLQLGIRSVWNDNNEFDIPGGYCCNEGNPVSALNLRSVLPMLMNQVAWEALTECYPDQRPYLVSRSGCAGINRYAQVWTGDNRTGWDSLKWNIATMLGSGLSGMPITGSDVGGFAGPAPEMELFLRWIACGVVMPRFSIHSANNDNTVTEPWMYPSQMDKVRSFFRLRDRLMPLLYSLHYVSSCGGWPIWRPMVWQFPRDKRSQRENVDFMLGDGLLVACVVEKGAKERKVWLPEGTVFYDFYTRERYEGGQEITLDAPLDKLPLLQRGGSILPTWEHDGTHLWVCPEESCDFLYYDDNGTTTNAFAGENDYLHYALERSGDTVTLCGWVQNNAVKEKPLMQQINVQCVDKAPAGVWVDGKELHQYLDSDAFWRWESDSMFDPKWKRGWHYDHERKLCCIHPGKFTQLTVSFSTVDLIKIDGDKEK